MYQVGAMNNKQNMSAAFAAAVAVIAVAIQVQRMQKAATDKEPLPLSKTFNDVSRHPALRFVRGNDLDNESFGIAALYRIPDGVTAAAYEDKVNSKAESGDTGYLRKSWAKLVALNPALEDVELDKDRLEDILDAHMGATSGFNVDDINFYIEQRHLLRKPALHARGMLVHGDRIKRIEAASKTPVSWVPSPRTAVRMEKALHKKGLM
jgi:hypothetical protein